MRPCPAVQDKRDRQKGSRTFGLSNLCGTRSRVLDDGYWHSCELTVGHQLPHLCTDPCTREFSGTEEATNE